MARWWRRNRDPADSVFVNSYLTTPGAPAPEVWGMIEDLGFKIEMQNLASDALVNRIATQPESLDIADIEYWMQTKLAPRGVLQGIDLKKFKYWDKVVPIFTKGEYPDGRKVSSQGILPYKVQYLAQSDSKTLAQETTRWATLIIPILLDR